MNFRSRSQAGDVIPTPDLSVVLNRFRVICNLQHGFTAFLPSGFVCINLINQSLFQRFSSYFAEELQLLFPREPSTEKQSVFGYGFKSRTVVAKRPKHLGCGAAFRVEAVNQEPFLVGEQCQQFCVDTSTVTVLGLEDSRRMHRGADCRCCCRADNLARPPTAASGSRRLELIVVFEGAFVWSTRFDSFLELVNEVAILSRVDGFAPHIGHVENCLTEHSNIH
mmetsp:Transcript_34122/g.105463  ORF Transcript_34122/g.105463 Transcript_34122/m.105463 type:complete len:223 (-) Transcript_34122:636-1304(-)